MQWPISRAVTLLCAALTAATTSWARADAIDDYVRVQMERQRIPGVAVAVVRAGRPVKIGAYGLSNVELDAAVRAETPFRIASVSKQFLATAALLLVGDGKLRLDDRVSKHVEDAPEAWAAITVRQLLTHTSGLRAESPGFDGLAGQSNGELVRNAFGEPLLFAPGEKFSYSNLGYYVLAEVIEQAAGTPWPQFLAQRIFAPLEMTATRTTNVFEIVPNRAAGYIYRDDVLTNARPLITVRASGALLTSVADLAKWEAALAAHALVPRVQQELMWTPTTLPDGTSTRYGFGWWIDDVRGHRRIRHGGTNPGFAAEISRFVDENLSVIVLTNGGCARPDAMAVDIADTFIPGLSPPRRTIEIEVEALAKYAGRYRFGPGDVATIKVDGDALAVQGDTPIFSSQCRLFAESATTFFISRDESYVFTLENGAVTQLTVEFGAGQRATAVKLR